MNDAPSHIETAKEKQRSAADSAVSAWVRANAGTGKTHVLVQRILRLFLAGAEPRSILCLTFTKNAAAEMEGRVLAELGRWATAGDDALIESLTALLARTPDSAELAAARCLFAAVTDAPGGLAIMTIHSFCERVLRRYSFEANVPPGFKVLTEEEARDALSEATAQAFASAAASRPLRDALSAVVVHAGEAEFSRVLHATLGHRKEIAYLLQVGTEGDPIALMAARLRPVFGLALEDTGDSLLMEAASVLNAQTLIEIIAALSAGTKSDLDAMARFQAVTRAADAAQRCLALKAAFATNCGEPRKSLMTAAVRNRARALHEQLMEAQAAFLALDDKIRGLKTLEATLALLRLTVAIIDRYEAEKHARAAVDFDDLIGKTLSLLSRADAAEWVLYQLDARIDHILVDEAQDTSPEQWEVVNQLTSDFFSGEGARQGVVPTIFAVGDEKQSIYGFQGAAPELLARHGALYERKAREADFSWRTVDLNLSFRTLAPVLAAVDEVTAALPGLQHAESVPHVAHRSDGGGLVELWEPERGDKEDKGAVWELTDSQPPKAKPAEALAARIAAQIKHWIVSEEGLLSLGRRIGAGDILILLRKREPMAGLLQAALKREGIPVAGADRMGLLDELAVMDLLALSEALLQPEDDLALAEVLKGPLFGFSDDDLFHLAYGGETSLSEALDHAANSGDCSKFAFAAEKLTFWQEMAHRLSPFDFLAQILEAEGGRKSFAGRLGVACFDALDELLNLAETFSAGAGASLSEFLVFVRQGASEVKRETDQAAREVRIMTVHGAKGLEANIVILADACSNRSAQGAPVFLVDDASGVPVPVWAIKGASRLAPIASVKERRNEAEQRELGRLLYVAMTRARDRLYVTGFHKGDLPAGCWYDTIRGALASKLEQGTDFQGRPVWRYGSAEKIRYSSVGIEAEASVEVPAWLHARPKLETRLPILSPSRMASLQREAFVREARGSDRKAAQAAGTMVHRLLEVLPALHPDDRPRAAKIIALAFSDVISAQQADEAVRSALALLADGSTAPAHSLAEPGIAVALYDAAGQCRAIIIGQADRILLGEREIDILDYKSGELSADAGLSSAYNAQLAAYRLALQRIYPAANIRASLIKTRSMAVVPAQDQALDAFLASFSDTLCD